HRVTIGLMDEGTMVLVHVVPDQVAELCMCRAGVAPLGYVNLGNQAAEGLVDLVLADEGDAPPLDQRWIKEGAHRLATAHSYAAASNLRLRRPTIVLRPIRPIW